MKNLPTLEQCYSIVDKTNDGTYYSTETIVDGYKVVMFNYRFVPDFKNPLGDNSMTGHELRGLTFLIHPDGTNERFILLDKNFNINQVEETQYDVIKDLKIKQITLKEDGSVISFVKLPNGKFVAKSKNSFESYQALSAQELFEANTNIQKFISDLYNIGLTPIFEYTSPNNNVVIPYNRSELTLLKVRDLETGEYIDVNNFKNYNIKIVDEIKYDGTLLDLINSTKSMENIEGYMVEFTNGLIVKLKTEWYCARHNLYTGLLVQLNSICSLILNDEIDDIICDPNVDDFKKDRINTLSKILSKYINDTVNEIVLMTKGLEDMDKYDIFLKFKKYKYRTIVLRYLRLYFGNIEWLYKTIKRETYIETFRLQKCKTFLSELGYKE